MIANVQPLPLLPALLRRDKDAGTSKIVRSGVVAYAKVWKREVEINPSSICGHLDLLAQDGCCVKIYI